MDGDTTSPAPAPEGFFGDVSDVLGAINQFGATAANIRDRFRAQPAGNGAEYASRYEHASSVAPQSPQGPSAPAFNWKLLLVASVVLLAVGLGVKALVKS